MNQHMKAIQAFIALMTLFSSSVLFASDTGVLKHFLNLNVELPSLRSAVSADEAAAAVRSHIARIKNRKYDSGPGMRDYWTDYRKVLSRYDQVSSARPVLIINDNGDRLVARYLVGVRMRGAVGGFFSVDPRDASIMTELQWSPELKPLWLVPESLWDKAESVNDIAGLEELVPPFTQFTTGIPIDPRDKRFRIIDGLVGELPHKTQEERQAQVEWFNKTYGLELKVQLGSHFGRRTATSKCISVAASYVGDWWTVRTGRQLPSYKNGANGKKEYGFNPRLLETMYYHNHKAAGLTGKWLGDWKVPPPPSKDRVTGEGIPFSARGFARLLVETKAAKWKDPLVPSLLSYETHDNHFNMDQKPLAFQIFTTGFFPRNAIWKALRDARDPDYPFSLAQDYGKPVEFQTIADAIETWGPLLGQHIKRKKDGSPATGTLGIAVHGVMVCGYGEYEGKKMLVYKETFGNASHRYLEDSYMGPAFRVMPLEYFYQVIAFPHHLYLSAKVEQSGKGAAAINLAISTNRRKAPVSVDEISVFVNGVPCASARVRETTRGNYKLWIPIDTIQGKAEVEIRAVKKYFADRFGRRVFSTTVNLI